MATLTDTLNRIMAELDEPIVSDEAVGSLSTLAIRRVVGYINDCYREVWGIKPHDYYPQVRDAITTVAGTQNYTPNAALNLKKLEKATFTNGQSLTITTFDYYDDVLNPTQQATTGQPQYIFESNGLLSLWPIPGGVYVIKLRGVRQFVPLKLGTDTFILPPELEDVVYWGALAVAKAHENDPDALDASGKYKKRLLALRAAEIAAGPIYEMRHVDDIPTSEDRLNL